MSELDDALLETGLGSPAPSMATPYAGAGGGSPSQSQSSPSGSLSPEAGVGAAPGAGGSPHAALARKLAPYIIQQESGGRAGVAGQPTPYGVAHGLMQVLDSTGAGVAKYLGIPWRPNLMRDTSGAGAGYQKQIGTGYLQQLSEKFDANPIHVISAFFGGPDQSKWGPKTAKYAQDVLARMEGKVPGQGGVLGSLFGKPGAQAGAAVQDYGKGIAGGIVRAPGQLIGGTLDTLYDAGRFVGDNMHSALIRAGVPESVASGAGQGFANASTGGAYGAIAPWRAKTASLADTLSFRSTVGQWGNPSASEFTAQALPFLAALPFGGAEAEGAGWAAKALSSAKTAGAAGLMTALVSDPNTQRLSDMIQQSGLANPVSEFLASNSADPAVVSRFKNAVEGTLGTLAVEPVFKLVSAIAKAGAGDVGGAIRLQRAAKQGLGGNVDPSVISEATPEEALQDRTDRAFATVRTQDVRAEQAQLADQPPKPGEPAEAAPVESLDDGTRHTDGAAVLGGEPVGSAGTGTPLDARHQLAEDVNAALGRSGVDHRVSAEDMQLSPDGRVVVPAAVKDAADRAGFGRVVAADNESVGDHVIFKEELNGGSRVVGMMPREQLQDFVAAVDRNVSNPDLNITHEGSPEQAAPHGEMHFVPLGASYEVPAIMRAVVERTSGVERPFTDQSLMQAAKSVADELGLDPDEVNRLAGEFTEATGKGLPTGMVVLRTQWTRMANSIQRWVGTDWSGASEEAVSQALQSIHSMMTMTTHLEEFKTGIGRALRVNALPDADTYMENFRLHDGGAPEAAQLPDRGPLPGLPRTREELDTWMQAWDALKDDPINRTRMLKGLTFAPGKWTYLKNSFANWYVGSIVSGVSTFVRDLAGPAVLGGIQTLERTAGGAIGAINPLLSADARKEAWMVAQQAPMSYAQTIGDVGVALKWAAKSLGDKRNALGLHHAPNFDFDIHGVPQGLIDAALAKSGPGVTGPIPYWLGNAVNIFPSWVQAMHGSVNEFAARLSYNGQIRASAALDGAKQGIEGADLQRFINSRLDAASDPVTGAATDQDALDHAARTTLVKSVSEEDPQWQQATYRWVNALRTNHPSLRYLLPIFTVPANAIAESLRRIPGMGLALSESRAELLGEHGAIRQAEAYGRHLTGAAALAGGAMLAQADLITGPGPSESHARALWQTTHQPYSLRVGDKWVSYNKLDVIGPMLATMAHFYDKSVYEPEDKGNAAYTAVGALAQYFKDQSALQGLSEVLNFGGDPAASQGYLSRIAGQITGGFVPNFIHQLARNNMDPDSRIKRTPMDWIKDALPVASSTLDPVRNLLGEEVHKPQNALLNTLPLSMSNASVLKNDPVLNELTRLYEKTGYAPSGVAFAPTGGHFDARDAKLENGRSLYDALMAARQTSQVDGQGMREALTGLFNSPEYNSAVDADQSNKETSTGELSRGYMVHQVFNAFNKQAHQDVASSSPIAARWLATAAAKNQDDASLRAYKAQDLVRNPGLYKALGIDIDNFESKVKGQ